ncbi:undecaprenyl/decaprenyl-phosphate alpha-N-acetylglucosaminyl 1-phosphate transferase [Candidatus Gottesmanbacteria bacterium]|nr:undecaprenyl/decaprenyl-phosphate alpha-N-acetylglucosaminyl 1-phosphate transferase [Candidatus Gottesmanbacteria bacterium]
MEQNLLFLGSIAFLVTFLTTPLVARLAKRFELVDDPSRRFHPAHIHKGIIPRAGGLAIYLGFAIACFLFLPINKVLLGILVGSLIVILIGLWDDKKDLSPYFRFLTNFLAAGLVVGAGVGIPYITNPFNGVLRLDTWRISFEFLGPHSVLVWADLFAVLWIVWCANMVNWSKGVDGQMPGFVAIAALTLGILSFRFSAHDISQWVVTALSFITAGAFLGFLPWNFYPQKIMPGYGGGTLAGFLLAVLSILSWGKLGTAILVLGVPMIDAFYVLVRRLASGKSPFWGDRGHLHHKLLGLGWGRRRIAISYWLVSAILGSLALSINSQQKLFTIVLLAVILGGVLLWFNYFKQTNNYG